MAARSRQVDSSLALLRRGDPIATAHMPEEVEAALDAVAREITRRPRRVMRRRSSARVKLTIVASALVVLSGGVATAAVVLRAHTGLFPSKSEMPIGGPGEELNPAASDFRSAALAAASDIPYPDGYASWREWVLTVQTPTAGDKAPGDATFPAGLVTSGALRGWFAASAFCAWVQIWRQTTITGDAEAADRAAETIAGAPKWKAVTAEDPNPSPSAPNDPGARPGTLFGWMLPYRDAVLAGDRERVEQLLAAGYGDGRCWLADPDWMAQLQRHSDWSQLSPTELARRYKQFLASERS